MPAKLIAMRDPEKPPFSEQLFQKALESWTTGAITDFATNLLLARAMWKQHRELVEAPACPEPFRSYASRANIGENANYDFWKIVGLSLDQVRNKFRRKARETAKKWAENGVPRKGSLS